MFDRQKFTQSIQTKHFFLLLLPVFFIINGSNELFGFLSFGFVFLNFLIVISITLLLFFIFHYIMKNREKAAVYTCLLMCFGLFFGYIYDSIWLYLPNSSLKKARFLLPVIMITSIALYLYLQKGKISLNKLISYLNILFFLFIAFEIKNSIIEYKSIYQNKKLLDPRFRAFITYSHNKHTAIVDKPDIFFLIFDGFGARRTFPGWTNNKTTFFDSAVKQEGFFTPLYSISNYNATILSVSSTLNMDYVPDAMLKLLKEPKLYFLASESILNNSLIKILKSENYTIHSFQPLSFRNPDWQFNSQFDQLRDQHFLNKTILGRTKKIMYHLTEKISKAQIDTKTTNNSLSSFILNRKIIGTALRKQELLETIRLVKQQCNNRKDPKFVYGHFMVPHPPYIFDEMGNLLTPEKILSEKNQEMAYYEQVKYSEKIITDLIHYIKKYNRKNTVIIIAGDHGRPVFTETDTLGNYRYENLSAIYFPDQNYDLVYDSLSSVNVFRLVLNKYFSSRIPLLKDSCVVIKKKLYK